MDSENLKRKEALEKSRKYCARQETCSGDMKKKLGGWGLETEDTEWVIENLIREKFIDDNRYAAAFARDRFRFNRWGRLKIGYALRMKGMADETVTRALRQIDQDEYISLLRTEMQKKWRSLKGHPLSKKGSLLRFASSRGFEKDLIYRLIDDLNDGRPFEMGD